MECLDTGTSNIEVTVPIGGGQAFQPLVFSFTKRCVSNRFLFPYAGISALGIFGLFFLLSTCTMTACVKNFEAELGYKVYPDMTPGREPTFRPTNHQGEREDLGVHPCV